MNDTGIPDSVQQGETKAAEELLPSVYEELRKEAAQQMEHEAPGQTLQPTALVHEAWLRLASSQSQQWKSRTHFIRAAAEAMRRILVDRARRKQRERHGGSLARVDFDRVDVAVTTDDNTLLCVNEALQQLAVEKPVHAQLVELRFFVGLSIPEAAQWLDISEATAKRKYRYARAWLREKLTRDR